VDIVKGKVNGMSPGRSISSNREFTCCREVEMEGMFIRKVHLGGGITDVAK